MQSADDMYADHVLHAPLQESVSTVNNNQTNLAATVPAELNLASKLAGDVVIGTGVTFLVAPFLTVVDKAIVESAAGRRTIVESGVESLRGIFYNPKQYFKSPTFLMMWGVYAATYSTANSLKTISEHQDYWKSHAAGEAKGISGKPVLGHMGVFLGTTLVNSSSALLKDQAYAKMFGTNSTNIVVPKLSYAFWIARDFAVIGSSFVLPDLVSGHVAKTWDIDEKSAKSISQLVLPVAAQFVASPLHYVGLDVYNRDLSGKSWPDAVRDRSMFLYRGIGPVIAARIARIAPGYGIGGVLNTNLRDQWRENLIKQHEQGSFMMNDFASVGTLFQKKRIPLYT
jgi:hypothetical protein